MGGGGKGSNTTTSEFKPPQEFMDAYKEALAMARGPANKPYQQYTGQLVAGLSPTQQQGIANVNAAQGMALPAIQRGMQYTTEAARGITPELYNQFYSPYVRDVANTTFANLMESQAQQQSGLKGGAIQAGAFGGDRSGVAQSEMARQQQLANAMAMSNIYQQGYTQATGLAGQQVANLGAMGQQLAGLGAGAQGSVLQGAQAQMAAGAQEQATEQARLQAAYDQWMQYQAYPYQQAQFFANIAQGLGAGAGGSSSTTAPAPNLGSQILGGVGAIGSIYSDKRMKENIQAIGKLNDGQTVYRYNFKGDPKTQIGLLAQEVEESKPGAVTQVKGLKMVDYKGATEDAAEMSSMGGVVMPSSDRQGLAGGGIPYYPYGNALGYVPEGKIGISGDTIAKRAPSPMEDEGLAAGWQDIKPLSQSQIGGLRQMASDLGLDLPEKKSAEDNGDGEENERAPGLFSGIVGALRGNAANGGVAARGYYADGGSGVSPSQEEDQDYGPEAVESVPIEGLGAASEVPPDEVVVPEESDGVAAAATPEDQAPPFVIPGEKPRSGLGNIFDLRRAFASEENPSLIERVMGRRMSPEARSAIMNASFALMAGRSPFFATNLGQAGLVGSQAYYNALAQKQAAEKQEAEFAQQQYMAQTGRMTAETARDKAIREQKEAAERERLIEEAISKLPPEQQALARISPDKFFGASDPPSVIQEYLMAKKEGFAGTLADWKKIGTNTATRSFAPIPYTRPDGTIGYGIPREDGTFVDIETPEGVEFLSPFERARQGAAGTAEGKITTEQALAAPSDVAAADQALAILDQIVANPNIEMGTGFSSIMNTIPGTVGYDFQNLVNQAKSGAFLTAIDKLQGMGALSNTEGLAATAAIARMDTATSKQAFLKAVADYRALVNAGRLRALERMRSSGQQYVPPPSTSTESPAEQNSGPVYIYNPDTKELEPQQ